jgi:hypothetical protein
MRQPRFKIYHSSFESGNARYCTLYAAIGNKEVELVAIDESLRVMGIESYAILEQDVLQDCLQEIATGSKLMQSNCKRTAAYVHTPENVLLPEKYFTPDMDVHEQLELLFGELPGNTCYNDDINVCEVVNFYRVDKLIQSFLNEHFPSSVIKHFLSPLIEQVVNRSTWEGLIKIQFFRDHFLLVLAKRQTLHLAQSYAYAVPEDVAYHVLNACAQLGFNTQQAIVELEGMIDEVSPLYAEMQKYFMYCSTTEDDQRLVLEEDFETYPFHYFVPVLNLAI